MEYPSRPSSCPEQGVPDHRRRGRVRRQGVRQQVGRVPQRAREPFQPRPDHVAKRIRQLLSGTPETAPPQPPQGPGSRHGIPRARALRRSSGGTSGPGRRADPVTIVNSGFQYVMFTVLPVSSRLRSASPPGATPREGPDTSPEPSRLRSAPPFPPRERPANAPPPALARVHPRASASDPPSRSARLLQTSTERKIPNS